MMSSETICVVRGGWRQSCSSIYQPERKMTVRVGGEPRAPVVPAAERDRAAISAANP